MSDDSTEALSAMFKRADYLEAAALTFYREHPKAVRAATVLTYRCKTRGCLLLQVWLSPDGLMFYQPGYRLSPAVNDETSNEDGRRNNTTDGERRWKAQGGRLDDIRGWGPEAGLHLACNHVRRLVPSDGLLSEADAATPDAPTVRTIG